MSTARPFAYNPGSVLSGTEQYGTIAVGIGDNPYDQNYGGIKWWNGPDEDLGYCIGTSVPSQDQPTPDGNDGTVQFWRTDGFDDNEFISLSNVITRQNFSSSAEAVTWLNDNGYWTSYGGISPSPTPTPSVTPTPSSTPGDESLVDPIITENDEYIEVGNDEYLMFVDPSSPVVTPSSTPESTTPTPTASVTTTPSVTPTQTPTPTISETPTQTPTVTQSPQLTVTPTPTITPTVTPTVTDTPTSTPTPTVTDTPTQTPTQTSAPACDIIINVT